MDETACNYDEEATISSQEDCLFELPIITIKTIWNISFKQAVFLRRNSSLFIIVTCCCIHTSSTRF
jgi:hypothetical protein